MTYNIEFDEEKHIYRVNGIVTPSVSQKIRNVLKNDEPIPEYAIPYINRGTYVHKVIYMAITKQLDESSIDESVKGYYDSFMLWYGESGSRGELVEKILYEPDCDYCATLDYVGQSKLHEILDWKTGQIYDYYKAQLGGYFKSYMSNYPHNPINSVACVQLFKDGKKAKKHEFDIFDCEEDWNAINRVYSIKGRNK